MLVTGSDRFDASSSGRKVAGPEALPPSHRSVFVVGLPC